MSYSDVVRTILTLLVLTSIVRTETTENITITTTELIQTTIKSDGLELMSSNLTAVSKLEELESASRIKHLLNHLKNFSFSKAYFLKLRSLFSSVTSGQKTDLRPWAQRITKFIESRRTFGVGHRKRMQFALLPIMFKMGVMTTLLGILTVLTMKGLTVGVILLIFAFGSVFTKFAHVGSWGGSSGHQSGWHNQQPIHVHLHSPSDSHPKTSSYVYGPSAQAWDRTAGFHRWDGVSGPDNRYDRIARPYYYDDIPDSTYKYEYIPQSNFINFPSASSRFSPRQFNKYLEGKI